MKSPHRTRLTLQQQDRFPEPETFPTWQRLREAMLAALGLSLIPLLTGCAGFFVPPTPTPTPGTGSSFAYVSNSSSGSTYVNGYALSSATLTAATSSPYNLQYTPTAIAVTPSSSFVYIASDSAVDTGAIYGYSIGSGGALSILNSGTALGTADVESMAISPDGQWLFALDGQANLLDEFMINSSTGLLTLQTSVDLSGASGGVITPYAIEVSPAGDYVACALGTGGAETFSLTESTGAVAAVQVISPASASTGIFALASDGSDNLYAAGTAGLQVFSVTSAAVATQTGTYSIGTAARSVVLTPNFKYVYVANQGTSTISGFSNAGGTLTALTGSPFAAPTSVGALGADSTSTYLLAEGYSTTAGIQLYTIGAAGALSVSAQAPSAVLTTVPVAIGVSP